MSNDIIGQLRINCQYLELQDVKDSGPLWGLAQRSVAGRTGNWGQAKKLTASDAENNDRFGRSVAVSGDTAVVGANLEDGAGVDRGAAYVFEPLAVGGIAELPDVARTPLEAPESSGTSVGVVASIAAAIAAGGMASGGTACYARRRWLR